MNELTPRIMQALGHKAAHYSTEHDRLAISGGGMLLVVSNASMFFEPDNLHAVAQYQSDKTYGPKVDWRILTSENIVLAEDTFLPRGHRRYEPIRTHSHLHNGIDIVGRVPVLEQYWRGGLLDVGQAFLEGAMRPRYAKQKDGQPTFRADHAASYSWEFEVGGKRRVIIVDGEMLRALLELGLRVLVPEQLGTEENGSPAYSPPPLLVEANDVYGYASLCKGKCGLLDEDLISTVSTETCWYTEEWAWSAIRDEIDIYRPSNWLSQDTVRELFTTSHWNRAPSARCAMARDVLVWHGVDPDKIYDFVFGHRGVAWATLMESYLQDAQNRHVELLESLEKGGWRSDTYYRRGVHEICKQVEDLLACAGWDASQFDLARLKSFVDCVGSHLGFEEEGAA